MEMMIITIFNIFNQYCSLIYLRQIQWLYPIMLSLITATHSVIAAENNESLTRSDQPPPDSSDPNTLAKALNSEATPIAFKSSYVGLIVNRNYGFDANGARFTAPKTSWGAEYRFFYKDEWTLALTGEFEGRSSLENRYSSTFTLAQETQKIIRIYHPWYFSAGGRLSYHVPVRKISIPYERDQDRDVYTGAALSAAAMFILNDRFILMLGAHRWTSLSTQKENGLSTALTMLMMIR
jgi:hypothetical protein